ncbi:MAG: hypothetical protein E6G45_06430 [Actinobacteria bacterium]|nr:MAG: hypothetical protein E6G45_06430 [Actinomycetota bacterium]
MKRYYQGLEQGFLEPGRVSRRVWAVVSELVGTEAFQQTGWKSPQTANAYFRAEVMPSATAAPAQAAADEEDEIDALFLAGGSE